MQENTLFERHSRRGGGLGKCWRQGSNLLLLAQRPKPNVSRRWRGFATMSDRGQIYKLARLNVKAPYLVNHTMSSSKILECH